MMWWKRVIARSTSVFQYFTSLTQRGAMPPMKLTVFYVLLSFVSCSWWCSIHGLHVILSFLQFGGFFVLPPTPPPKLVSTRLMVMFWWWMHSLSLTLLPLILVHRKSFYFCSTQQHTPSSTASTHVTCDRPVMKLTDGGEFATILSDRTVYQFTGHSATDSDWTAM